MPLLHSEQTTGFDPTGHFTNLEPQHQEIGKFYVVQERRATDFEVSKVVQGLVADIYYLASENTQP